MTWSGSAVLVVSAEATLTAQVVCKDLFHYDIECYRHMF
jgi:hypothetical protein